MTWNSDPRYRIGGFWRCTVKDRARHARWYEQLSGVEYSRIRMRDRRFKALARQRKRRENLG